LSKGAKKKPTLPIYAIGAVWLLYSLKYPVNSIGRLVWVIVLSLMGFFIVKALAGEKTETAEEKAKENIVTKPAEPAKETPKYAPEVQAVVDEGKKAHDELQRLYESIPDLAVKKKVREIMDVSDKIANDAIDDPGDVPQIKKFQDYYLPTTIKLLNAYDRMGAQGVEGENISGTMQSINEMLDTAIVAYKKMLDSLFANQAMDIETDIDVMNTLLKREGLTSAEDGGLKL